VLCMSPSVEELTKKVNLLERKVSKLDKEVMKRLMEIEKILVQHGFTELVIGDSVWVYFFVPKKRYEEVKKEGLVPRPIPMAESERRLFLSILKKRGIDFPDKVIVGHLHPSVPGMSVSRYLILRAQIPIKYIYAGDFELFSAYMIASLKDRRKLVRLFAKSIVPLKEYKNKVVDLTGIVVFVTVKIPASRLQPVEHILFTAREGGGW